MTAINNSVGKNPFASMSSDSGTAKRMQAMFGDKNNLGTLNVLSAMDNKKGFLPGEFGTTV